jgi:hypothetical protein
VSNTMRWLGLVLVGLHGLGMIGGVYFVATSRGWLAGALGGEGALVLLARVVVGLVWVASGVLLVGAAWAFFKDLSWWRSWALLGAPLSAAGIVLWAGGTVPPGAYAGALFDVVILGYALTQR